MIEQSTSRGISKLKEDDDILTEQKSSLENTFQNTNLTKYQNTNQITFPQKEINKNETNDNHILLEDFANSKKDNEEKSNNEKEDDILEYDTLNQETSNNIKIFSNSTLDNIQKEIQEITKRIENEKIQLRICSERYEQKFKLYCELQGKVPELTKEEKEKEKKERLNQKRDLTFSFPLKRKQLKEKVQFEEQIKIKKELGKNQNALGDIENDINKLLLINQDLKNEVTELRKQKSNAILKRENVIKINKQKEKEIEQLKLNNEITKKQIKKVELKESIDKGIQQQKDFERTRENLEIEYHKLIQESIRKEREKKKEQANKKQMLILSNDSSNALFKGTTGKEIEKKLKLISNEEISDRTPMIEELIKKWKSSNKIQKRMIEKYIVNSKIINDIFKKILSYNNVNSYNDLNIVFQKNEEQMNNVNMYINRLQNEIGELETKNIELDKKIIYYKDKNIENNESKREFIKDKNAKISQLENEIFDLENEIKKKREFFTRIQPATDKFLSKMNNSYLSEFVPKKIQIDKNLAYTESSINNYIANVEDYFKLIQNFEEGINDSNKDNEDIEIDRLRNEIKNKLENFDKGKIFNKSLYSYMKNEQKNGLTFDDIIKKNSELIVGQINPTMNISLRKKGYGQIFTLNKSSSVRNLKKSGFNKRIYHGITFNKSTEDV